MWEVNNNKVESIIVGLYHPPLHMENLVCDSDLMQFHILRVNVYVFIYMHAFMSCGY